jgi:hypothetical protein
MWKSNNWRYELIMPSSYKERIFDKFPLFLGGLFLIYLAVLDDTLFNFIINNMIQNQFSVALATSIAAGVPMFLAIGFIKQTILRRWQTIYYYEIFILGIFHHILTVILLGIISYIIIFEEGIHQFNMPILAGCALFSLYLIVHALKIRGKFKP